MKNDMPLRNEIDILRFEKELKDTYSRYTYTANLISDQEPELKSAFSSALQENFSLFNGPFIHCTPNYKSSLSLRQLADCDGEFKIASGMLDFPPDQFDASRPLYCHQLSALKRLGSGENLIVATGTGSGKTECFLLPILDHILKNPGPGLRAIIIYPMNALADDQLSRLRRLLANSPDITFGRYTGDTPESLKNSRPDETISNERYTRQEMRDSPPNILLTNFAMLEYLMLRPRDADLFKEHALRFIVLDEAHIYSGAQGIEIALLMRRVHEYLIRDNELLQFVLTSATLGDEENALEKVTQFAEDISGVSFGANSVLRGETVDEFSEKLTNSHTVDLLVDIGRDEKGFTIWSEALDDPSLLCNQLCEKGLDCGEVQNRSVSRILYDLLHDSSILKKIHNACRKKPSILNELCKLLDVDVSDESLRGLQWYITMGAYARRSEDAAPLLPTRYHFFARGLAGATVCVWPACPDHETHPNTKWSSFYLTDRNECKHCASKVMALSTCVHCGLPVCPIYIDDDKWMTSCPPHVDAQVRLLVWNTDFEEPADDNVEKERRAWACLKCNAYSELDEKPKCCEDAHLVRMTILDGDDDGNLRSCPRCLGQSGYYPSVLREFRTTEDAPAAVLAETVIRGLPHDENDPEVDSLPAHGRNLLVFSDSRQRAAFFAPYLGQTTLESAYLSPLVDAIRQAERNERRPVTFEEAASVYGRNLDQRNVAVIRDKDEDEVENFVIVPRSKLRRVHKSRAVRGALILLYKQFSSSSRNKTTIPGTAIAGLEFDFNYDEQQSIPERVPQLFSNGLESGWHCIRALLEIFVVRKAIAFPENIAIRDLMDQGPKAVTYHLTASGQQDGRQVVRWNPYLAPENLRKRAVSSSRQRKIVSRFTGLNLSKDAVALEKILTDVWNVFTDGILTETETWPGEFRIDPSLVLISTKVTWGVCNRCGRITNLTDLGFCLTDKCDGSVEKLSKEQCEKLFEYNHYRHRYQLPPLALEVKEHTAQLTAECGKDYQRRFMKGEINVLSSSTTFEMGVDVGDLKAVVLRNVPPTTSSYIQRTGRAGRRKDGISIALTYCRNVPHDQYFYQSPESIIMGKVPAPYLNIKNKPLTQRHCNSLLLGYFLRSQKDLPEKILNKLTVDLFFLQEHDGRTLADKFSAWLEGAELEEMLKALRAIIPYESELNPDEVVSIADDTLSKSVDSVRKQNVLLPLERFEDQRIQIEEQMLDASSGERIGLARASHSLFRLIKQFKDERLIDFLSSNSWLPGYAFPQDVIKLIVRQPEFGDRMRLERDREVGISEYSPGAEIVADGHLFTSEAVWFNSKEPELRWYTRCPQCRKIDTYLITQRPSRVCTRCGTGLTGKFLPRKYMKPDGFTTLVSDPVRLPGRSRKPGSRTSEVFLLEGADPEMFKSHNVRGVLYAEKIGGRLFLANSGYDFSSYSICQKCGRGFQNMPNGNMHETPWGSQCGGKITTLDLVHEFSTDILQLRFDGCDPAAPDITDKSFWLSLVSTFLNGASDALNIDSSDLGGTYHGWTDESYIGELVIYDRIPGGAGHINRIINNLEEVLAAGLKRVEECKCPDLEASCYACLRNYGNQFYWEQLRRKPVIDWLSGILS